LLMFLVHSAIAPTLDIQVVIGIEVRTRFELYSFI
jgi:hypothetical protein